ncbi:MAG: DUF429 domain-containing protein [Cyanobacteria bacterium SZAS LIN-2]|nr:DUF429 domain-containing protein [Cyanobacteria bacterium SZAS LIN-2]
MDGCRRGWLCVFGVRDQPLSTLIAPSMAALVAQLPAQCLVAVDIPIGLPIADSRRAETAARAIVGPRRSSVFPVPLRAAILATDREEACRLQVARHLRRKRVGVQTWAIVPKIVEVDQFLRTTPPTDHRIVEVHPEVSFTLWYGRHLAAAKKSPDGRRLREALIDSAWPGDRERLAAELAAMHPGAWAFDDLNDAFAALWSAIRVAQSTAQSFPAEADGEVDAYGIPMRILG